MDNVANLFDIDLRLLYGIWYLTIRWIVTIVFKIVVYFLLQFQVGVAVLTVFNHLTSASVVYSQNITIKRSEPILF